MKIIFSIQECPFSIAKLVVSGRSVPISSIVRYYHSKMTATVDFSDVKNAISNKEVILDVRNRPEVEELGQIPSSICIPLPEISEAADLDAAAFQSKYGFAKPGPDDAIITHCMKGGRAQKAADALVEKGFKSVRVYKGSFNDWVAQKGDLVKLGK